MVVHADKKNLEFQVLRIERFNIIDVCEKEGKRRTLNYQTKNF